jgi:hypothetical protein
VPGTDHEPSGAQESIEGAVTHTPGEGWERLKQRFGDRLPEVTDEDRRRALESLEQTRAEFQRTHDADWYADELGESGRLGYAAGERAGYERARKEIVEALRQADTTGWPGGRASDVAGCQEAAVKIAESVRPSDG